MALKAAEDKVKALTVVIAAQAEVDTASAALADSADDAAALKTLEAAETALAAAKTEAGLETGKQ